MNKAIFLDRDGTINEDNVGYTYKIQDLKFLPKAIEGLKILQEAKYNLIIITNQSGIGRELYTKKDYFNFRNELSKKLKESNIFILKEYFCPHDPYKNCNCRKPRTGMLEKAAKDFNLDLTKCWMIGDKESDILAGKNVRCKTIQVLTGKNKYPISFSDFIAQDLEEAAKYILDYHKNK
jgi:D-glycero-D-manno-heptose 1,7-bisphosphate phosphatase